MTLLSAPLQSTMSDRVRIVRTEGLYFSRRDGAVLVVEPQTASWIVLRDQPWRLMAGLAQPCSFSDVVSRFPDLPRATLSEFVQRLYGLNMLRLDGKAKLDVSTMWD